MLYLFSGLNALYSQSKSGFTLLTGEIWYEQSLSANLQEGIIKQEELINSILEEAVYLFSGMIYGFAFSYTPQDKVRGTRESFTLEPIAQIPWGDPNLEAYQTYSEEGKTFVKFKYSCSPEQEQWLYRYNTRGTRTSRGYGSGSYQKGPSERYTSIEEGIKNGIRESLRQELFTKPREILGTVRLLEIPRLQIKNNYYIATVRISFLISDVLSYRND